MDAVAQRTGRNNRGGGGGTGGQTNQPPDTTRNPNVQQNNNQPPTNDPYAGATFIYDTVRSDAAPKKALRNDNAFDKSSLSARTPLEYEHLRWDDALFAHKVWREIDVREKINKVFTYNAEDDNGSQVFMSMIMKAVNSGSVTVFDASDDRFTTPLTLDGVGMATTGSTGRFDTIRVKDPNNPNKFKIKPINFDPAKVVKFQLLEEWVFDRESSRLFCRILGICPLMEVEINGKVTGQLTKLFWIYYPDLRPMLAKSEVYNPKNMGRDRLTWEELFESRMFSSYIVKSTLDNPSNQSIRGKIKDGILALLEGENIKEKIFNYEQDLWSY